MAGACADMAARFPAVDLPINKGKISAVQAEDRTRHPVGETHAFACRRYASQAWSMGGLIL